MHQLNIFITLTYNDEHLPPGGSLVKADFQNFMKRLRKVHSPNRLSYYMCGEYGENFSRPHYHAILFGIDFPDKIPHSKNEQGDQLYHSPTLEKIWGLGFAYIGGVNFQTAAYVSRYVMKKINGEQAKTHYEKFDVETGEIFNLQPEYSTMSTNPAIGKSWFEKYRSDVFPSDEIIYAGKQHPVPKYYTKLLAADNAKAAQKTKWKRINRAKKNRADNTPERLAVRLEVKQSKVSQLKRSLK